jgi:hypothetical protein
MSLASQSQILAACARNVLVRAHELHQNERSAIARTRW